MATTQDELLEDLLNDVLDQQRAADKLERELGSAGSVETLTDLRTNLVDARDSAQAVVRKLNSMLKRLEKEGVAG